MERLVSHGHNKKLRFLHDYKVQEAKNNKLKSMISLDFKDFFSLKQN